MCCNGLKNWLIPQQTLKKEGKKVEKKWKKREKIILPWVGLEPGYPHADRA